MSIAHSKLPPARGYDFKNLSLEDCIDIIGEPISSSEIYTAQIRNEFIGGGRIPVIQSMTDTDTADVEATTAQIVELYNAGSKIVRMTVNNDDAAKAVPYIRDNLEKLKLDIPLVSCMHYNGHELLAKYPECARAVDKYRINPGNVGKNEKHDIRFAKIIEIACKHHEESMREFGLPKSIRIGVNWGSLDQSVLQNMIDVNLKSANPRTMPELIRGAMIRSALESATYATELGFPKEQIILSCKSSKVKEVAAVYHKLRTMTRYPLHIGLTEAGTGENGVVKTAVALAIILNDCSWGDTIRASITNMPGESRTKEVELCKEILQALEMKQFFPSVTACPACGRTSSQFFKKLADQIQHFLSTQMSKWEKKYPGVETMNVAVMGCTVNGPGESKHADIGISLPGTGENPSSPVYIDKELAVVLKNCDIAEEFKKIIEKYVHARFGNQDADYLKPLIAEIKRDIKIKQTSS